MSEGESNVIELPVKRKDLNLELRVKYGKKKRHISTEEALGILGFAGMLSSCSGDNTLLDSEVEKLSTVDSGAPMSVLYDTAQKLGIARKYVDQALKIRQPTTEDVRELLKGYDVGQRKQDVGKRYGLELCNCMRETFPEQKENMPQGYDLELTRHLMRPISVTYIDVSPEDISADAVHNVRRSAIDITLFCELADGCYDGGN